MRTNAMLCALLSLIAISCVNGPTAPEAPAAIPQASAVLYGSTAGDSLQLLSDGRFLARPSEGTSADGKLIGWNVTLWIVGRYEIRDGQVCAKPNMVGNAVNTAEMRCGATVSGNEIVDGGVFLWDGVPRTWRVR